MRIFVTGAGGFLGSEIVRQAAGAGMRVRAMVRRGRPDLPALVEYASGDLLRHAELASMISGSDCVVHAAGLAHVFGGVRKRVAEFKRNNEEGTANVTGAAARAGVRHIVLISSVAVYGRIGGEVTEGFPCNPQGPYGESKFHAEQRASDIAKRHGVDLTILRLATLYGEEDPGKIARLIRIIDKGRFVWVGDGSNRKSLLHREDAARACLAAVRLAGAGVGTYNVCAEPCTVRELVEEIASALKRRLPRWRIPAAGVRALSGLLARLTRQREPFASMHGAVQKWLGDDAYDGKKFRATFGFQPTVSLRDGLRREVSWYLRGR